VPILSEAAGRVAEVHAHGSEEVVADQPLLRLDDRTQRTAVERGQRGVTKVELSKTVVRAGINGRAEQFVLQVGDVVHPILRVR